jgi:hypothetical protein
MLAPSVGGKIHSHLGFVHPGGGTSREGVTVKVKQPLKFRCKNYDATSMTLGSNSDVTGVTQSLMGSRFAFHHWACLVNNLLAPFETR